MNGSEVKNRPKHNLQTASQSSLLLAAISLCALVATFLSANSDFSFETKITVFVSIVFLYLLFCFVTYLWQKRDLQNRLAKSSSDSSVGKDIEGKLLALEEASQFFGASLKSGDMFRLVASRINELIPFAVCALYLADEKNSKLNIVNAIGENAEKFIGVETSSKRGLAGKTFETKTASFDGTLQTERGIVSDNALNNLNSAVAVPLLQAGEAFGVLMLYGTGENKLNRTSLPLLEAVGARVAPLFYSSQIYEDNLANALTDSLTKLPNERAFYLVLENQIAESQRFRDERPLTVLVMDIAGFDELNGRFGHATGDRMLEYAADNIKNQLRQMDFLARASGDEFYAVLPTASDEVTQEIVERIRKTFVLKPFEVSREEKINLHLNFGAASFWKNGETAAELLKHAVLRKQQSKSAANNNILWFPKEFIN